jgi:hypothetical protein
LVIRGGVLAACMSRAYVAIGSYVSDCGWIGLRVQRHHGLMTFLTFVLWVAVFLILASWNVWRYRRTLWDRFKHL